MFVWMVWAQHCLPPKINTLSRLLCSAVAESELLNGKQILLFSLPFSRNVSCPRHHKVSFKVTVILTAVQCTGSLMTWRLCHLFVAILGALSCLLVCVIMGKERVCAGQGGPQSICQLWLPPYEGLLPEVPPTDNSLSLGKKSLYSIYRNRRNPQPQSLREIQLI